MHCDITTPACEMRKTVVLTVNDRAEMCYHHLEGGQTKASANSLGRIAGQLAWSVLDRVGI